MTQNNNENDIKWGCACMVLIVGLSWVFVLAWTGAQMDKIVYCHVCREEMESHECEMCTPETEAEKARTEQEIGNYMDSLGSES